MDAIWLKQYPAGVPVEINPDEYPSLAAFLVEMCERHAKKVAFMSLGSSLTYRATHQYADAFAQYLRQHLKLKAGDRVAVMLPNLMQYPIAVLGALIAGLVVVNVNPLYTARELKYQLRDSGAKVVVVLDQFAHVVENVLPETGVVQVIVTETADLLPFWKRWPIQFMLQHVYKKIKPYQIKNATSWQQVFKVARTLEREIYPVASHDIAFLQYTGGTTGVSKGAILTHRNMLANIAQILAWINPFLLMGDRGQETVLTALPLYHIFSLTANLMTFMACGGRNILIPDPRKMKHLVSEMRKYSPSVITGVNTLFKALVSQSEMHLVNFKRLSFTVGGGMAVQRSVAEAWQKMTGKPIIEAYGLTETSPAAVINPLNIPKYRGYIGVPISSTQVMILDEAGEPVPLDTPGELCIKGPQVMKGYWQKPEETQRAFTADGWFKTGDIAVMNVDGFLRIVDRKKDMILVSGFNVYPNEIEDVLALHPGVAEVAAIGVQDMKSGEAVKIFVVKKDPNLTEEALKEYCLQNFTAYKQPRHIEFRTELPKTNVGKILRRALKEEQQG